MKWLLGLLFRIMMPMRKAHRDLTSAEQIGMSDEDLELIETRKEQFAEIAYRAMIEQKQLRHR